MPLLIEPEVPNDSPTLASRSARTAACGSSGAPSSSGGAAAAIAGGEADRAGQLGVRRDHVVGQDPRRRVLLEGLEDHFERCADIAAAAEMLDRLFEQHAGDRRAGGAERLGADRSPRPTAGSASAGR